MNTVCVYMQYMNDAWKMNVIYDKWIYGNVTVYEWNDRKLMDMWNGTRWLACVIDIESIECL